jgi:alpha-galactosidase
VRSVGGGQFHGFYPPGAYRENEVVFRQGVGDRYRIESGADGRSSNRDLPFLQMTVGGAVNAGLVVSLEWSGLWFQEIGFDGWGSLLVLEAGIPVEGLVLGPGERLPLPEVHLIAFEGDQDAGGNACRRYVYDRISPKLGGRPVLSPTSYNHWSGIERALDEPFLRRLADRAAELGVEYFVLDAGWYAGVEDDYNEGLGNWERVNPAMHPEGLGPAAEYVRSKGLKLGLWFEPEHARRNSDMARSHPEWFFDIGTPDLHLDLSQRAAQDYIIGVLGGWIERLGLEWLKLDYNIGPRQYWEKADPTGKVQFEYMAGLYRVLDALMESYPRCLMETCASGGRRIDLGVLRRVHSALISDHSADALICRFMQSGANRFLPGNLLNNELAVEMGAGDGTTSDADVISRMCGALQFTGDIASWSPRLTARVSQLMGIHRELRKLLAADFYPLTPQPARLDEVEVVQFIDRDGSDAVVFGFGGTPPADRVVVRPRALDAESTYLVWDPLVGGEAPRSGRDLLERGLAMPLRDGAAIRRLRREAG